MNKRLLFASALLALLSGPAALAQVWVARDLGSATASLGVNDFDMPSASVIWGINYDGSGGGGVTQDMFVSTDGGLTWQTNTITTANSAGKTLTNVSAIDGSTAYIGGFDATNGGGVLFKTTNSGGSFTEVTIPTMTYLNIVHFFDDSTGVLIGDPTGTGTYWEVFRTTDAATTWTRVPQASIPAANTGDYGFTNQYDAVGDNIWFTSLKGSVYHSTDRGLTWMKHASGFTASGTTGAVKEIAFSDAMNGLIVGRNGMRNTTDGGMTWNVVTPIGLYFNDNVSAVPGQPNTYVGVSANVMTGVGSAVTHDAGLTWTVLDSSVAQYTDVIFFDEQHGWSGGFTQATGTEGVFEYVGAPLAVRHELVREAAAAYPNPTTGLVRLAGADPRETVTVYDLQGRMLRQQAVPANGLLDLNALEAGIYQLVFTGGPVPRTTRVAVER